MGRSSLYTKDLAVRICDELSSGKSLREICEADGMPAESTVRGWVLEDYDGFAAQYARARETQADTYADDIVRIADTTKDANLARVQIDARKWVAGKLRPKVYGDRLDLNHSGAIERLTDDQLNTRLDELLRKARSAVDPGGVGET